MIDRALITLAIGALCMATSAYAEPRYKLDKQKIRVIEITDLNTNPECHPFNLKGRIVKRGYDDADTRIVSVVVEEKNGDRALVHIQPVEIDSASRVTIGWIYEGLNTLLKKGNAVSLRVIACGAAGRVLMLDAVKPL